MQICLVNRFEAAFVLIHDSVIEFSGFSVIRHWKVCDWAYEVVQLAMLSGRGSAGCYGEKQGKYDGKTLEK